MFTSGYELTTAITNVLIFIVSIYCFVKVKDHGLWKLFFFTMIINSFLGSIAHGIVLSETALYIMWIIIMFFFTITVNTLLCIFMKLNIFGILLLSGLLFILMLTQIIFDMDYLFTFDMYVLLILFVCSYYIFIEHDKNNLWFIIGFVLQLIGGLLMIFKIKFGVIDHNGIYHLFMIMTLIFLYIGVNKKYNVLKL